MCEICNAGFTLAAALLVARKWIVLWVRSLLPLLLLSTLVSGDEAIRLRVSPSVINDGGKVTVTCVVPEMQQRLRVWIGIQNVQESEIAYDSERIETFVRAYRVFCGAGDAYCVLSSGQVARKHVSVGGCN